MSNLSKKFNWLSWLGAGLTELLFPPGHLCPVCFQERSLQKGLGQQCLNKLKMIVAPYCIKCGKPLLVKNQPNQLCRQCESTELFFAKARAVALYEGALREYLADLKYRFRPELGRALGELLVEWVRANPEFRRNDLVIPILIHPHKLAVRGYNQAELLANPLADYLGMVVQNQVLVRTKLTETQNSLNRVDRFANVKNAFEIIHTSAVSGKRVLLIDDILTTGATVSEAARLLLKAGASEINVLTLATGIVEPDRISR